MYAGHENEESSIIIPQDVIKEILLRLPPKSLLRFKAVSKSWCALICSSSFVYRHLDFIDGTSNGLHIINFIEANVNREPALHALLLADDGKILEIEGVPPPLSREIIGEDWDLPYFIDSPLSGPVNGIYCISIKCTRSIPTYFVLWNPGNRHYHVVPLMSIPHYKRNDYLEVEFGYDYSNDDYNIFVISNHLLEHGFPIADYFSYCHLYSLATNSWKLLDPFKICNDSRLIKLREDGRAKFQTLLKDWAGSYLNGASHRLYNTEDDMFTATKGILSFDFGTQLLRVFSALPQGVEESQDCHLKLCFPIDGCLTLVCCYSPFFSIDFDVYLMREYGVQESWIKAYTIPNPLKAQFIGIFNHQLFVYDNNNQPSRVLSYCLLATRPEQEFYPIQFSTHQILPYSGSLVPIKPCDELVKKKKKKKEKKKKKKKKQH